MLTGQCGRFLCSQVRNQWGLLSRSRLCELLAGLPLEPRRTPAAIRQKFVYGSTFQPNPEMAAKAEKHATALLAAPKAQEEATALLAAAAAEGVTWTPWELHLYDALIQLVRLVAARYHRLPQTEGGMC